MKTFDKTVLTKKSENISEWYTDVVLNAELADYGPAKGTMVIRPYGYAIWERVQQVLDAMFKEYGVENAYFPLFIPYSLLEKEKEHVKGFSPELAVVTHGGGEELAEPLVVRPTSETIMYHMYAKWIKSYRDLPVLINQWNNAVRWEMRTYLFLRTTEFLWQEGHTAHETEEDAVKMQEAALEWYRQIYENYYAVPVIAGLKSRNETFAGAKSTYTVEALMPDGKALQGGTSHNLGQNFSRAFEIQFQNRESNLDNVWQTSWGFSTRSIGGLLLTHGDDNGIILPPKIAPIQIVIVPILRSGADNSGVIEYSRNLYQTLVSKNIRVKLDLREELSVGRKFSEWELKGVPLRVEVGQNESQGNTVTVVRRDNGEKFSLSSSDFEMQSSELLNDIQKSLFNKAKKFLEENTHQVNTYEEFKKIMNTNRGFIRAYWCGDENCEEMIKEDTKATTRALPFESEKEKGSCIYCSKEASDKWYFAQAY